MSDPFSWKNMLDSGMLDGPSILEQVNSKSKSPKKRSGSSRKISQYRYPRSYTNDKRDYLSVKICKYDRKDAEKPKNFSKYELTERGTNKGTGKFRYKVDKVALTLSNTFTDGFRGAGGSKKHAHTYINLPIPENVQDSNTVEWNTDTLDPISAGLVSAGAGMMAEPGQIAGKTQALWDHMASGNLASNLQMEGIDKELMLTYISGLAVKEISNINPQSLITRTTGQVLQSNMELLLDKPTLRSFSFNWNFMARDSSESKEILQIIRAFKMGLAMKTGKASNDAASAFFIKSPDIFELSFQKGSKKHPFLNSFKPCALTNIQTNYTGSTTYSTYRDGTPTHINLNATFQEINPIYAEDYNDSDGGKIGVGY